MKKIVVVVLSFAISLTAFGQDKHFTQFYSSPMNLNPALTGSFDGSHRIGLNYRTQWASLLPDPFVTAGVSFDMNFSPFKVKTYDDKIGVGLIFFNDKAGPSDFTTNNIALSGAFHKALDRAGKHYLSAGFQVGILQKSINYEGLTFNDQFDGSTGYTLPSAEDLPRNNYGAGDISAGIQWSLSPRDRLIIYAGASIFHLTRPEISFYQESETIDLSVPILMKYAINAGVQLPISRGVDLQPRVLIYSQGPHFEINAGANVRVSLSDYDDTRLYVGSWVRPVRDVEGSTEVDAVVLLVGFQFSSVQIGASYDVTVSPLANSTAGNGAFELSLSYIGSYENESILCPTF